MSTLSQSERQALNDIFSVIAQKESKTSKLKQNIIGLFYFLKYFFKDKKSTKFLTR